MKILFVSHYFPPEVNAPASRVHRLAQEWVAAGHEVTVVTGFAHHPHGIKAHEDRFVLTRRERKDGIDVVRCYVYATANRGSARRMLSYASFMASAAVIGTLRGGSPDVVIATSPQLLCGLAGYLVARAKRVPFVFEVRDLWPETIIAVDAMESESVVIRGLRRLARFLYRHANHIVPVGEGYRQSIHELYNIPLEKMSIVHNGVDMGVFEPGPRDNDVRRQYGWRDKFVLMYIGTHGMCHGLHRALELARCFEDDPSKHFVFVGDGAEKPSLCAQAGDWELRNVEFIDQQPREKIAEFYAACDAGLVCLRASDRFQEVLPSKIFEYLGMERPILLSVGGEARKLVEAAGAGICVAPEDVEGMADGLRRLADDPEGRRAMGRRGRQYVQAHFDRKQLAHRYLGILQEVTDEYGA